MKSWKALLAGVCAIGISLVAAPAARADLRVFVDVDNNAATVGVAAGVDALIVDQDFVPTIGTIKDANATVDRIAFTFSAGGWDVTAIAAAFLPGDPLGVVVQITSVIVEHTAGGAGSLAVWVSRDGIAVPGSPIAMFARLTSDLDATGGSEVSYQGYFSDSEPGHFFTSTPTALLTRTTPGTSISPSVGPLSYTGTGYVGSGRLLFTTTAGGSQTFNVGSGKTVFTPEPSSALLALLGVPALAFWRRFGRKNVSAK